LAEVLKNLWEVLSQRQYSPTNFKNIISEMNPLFKGIAANDPKDLVLFLLQTMHKELHKPLNIVVNNNNLINNNNFEDVFADFIQYETNKNRSIISEEFNGYINSISMCAVCGAIIHNIQSYNILFFPLEEIRKFKNYNYNNNVEIKDCFQFNEKLDSYPSFYCNTCKNLCLNYNMSKLIYGPQTLIINLNRGRGLEYNVNIKLEEYLDLREFIFATESPYYYELIGVICHFGSNDEGGHFIAYCKNSNNCEWYKFNDQLVNKCTFDEVAKTGLPYVLFYNYVKV
jgi:ubiquitin C-terminal hydrolase